MTTGVDKYRDQPSWL